MLLPALAFIWLTAACAAFEPSIARPEIVDLPSPTAVPLYRQVTITSIPKIEHGQPFGFTIETQTPMLTGSDDPRVTVFNDLMERLVEGAAAEFKHNIEAVPPSTASEASSFSVNYRALSPPGALLSIKFVMEGYVTGAAHPFRQSRTVNFDLEHGTEVNLAELFAPGTNYLDFISNYCASQLKLRDIGFDGSSTGAEPTPNNYRNWNITSEGLMITFDEYQVAAYAAGPQIVVIPYAALRSLLQDPGLLTQHLPN